MRSWWWVKEKKKQMALVLIIVTMILQFQMKGCVGCVETERMGLLQLKSYLNSLRSPEVESILDSWSDDDPQSDCCNWEGVNCSDAIGGRIVNLSLTSFMFRDPHLGLNLSLLHSFPGIKTFKFSYNWFNHLFDPIHGYKSFQRLENLETLDLSHNYFDSSVLPFISAARSLRILNLGANSLGGVFFPPNGLEHLVELEALSLAENQFNNSRSIQVLKDMPKLHELDLRGNYFTDLDSLCLVFPSSLQVLNLRENQLSWTHEGYSKLCGLRNIRELDLSSNALTSMPNCLGNLSRLRTLELSYNQLNGNLSAFVSGLPPELEYLSLLANSYNASFLFNSLVNLTRLTVFRLSSKVGTIEAQAESPWVPVFQLKVLVLQNFILGNTIPGFLLHQHDLSYVDLSHNKLTTGPFARWLVQNNTRLQALSLNNNLLTELQLPRLVHGLQYLDVSSNMIYGSIQEDIGIVFPKMTFMNFSSNQFHGTIPPSMCEMNGLKELDMSSNGLSGQLPKTCLSGCYSLESLMLSNNQFQGKIFPEHANLTSLYVLLLDGNNFTGCIGEGLLNSKELRVLDLSDNSFSGMVPLWMGRLSRIGNLYMRGNQLRGPFPHQLLQSLRLDVMDISHNSFSGSIPRNLDFSSLRQLRLQNNHFWGSIPDTLFKGEILQVLDLRNNNFSGKIPNTIGENSRLRVLLLRNNSLQSHIPEQICQLSDIGLLDLSHNKFNGVIPSCLGNMPSGTKINDYDNWIVNLSFGRGIAYFHDWSYASALNLIDDGRIFGVTVTVVDFSTKNRYEAYQGDILSYMYGLDLSSNRLSGEIPVEIGDLVNMRSLNFSNNRLTGTIPYNTSKLHNLESLDLSNNKLYGNIPTGLANLDSLGYFNVSCNNFSGEIPFKGHLVTFDDRSYIGNAHLCGRPTNIICNPTRVPKENASTQAEEEEEDDEVIDMEWFYWTCGAVYISTCLALFAFLCIDTRWSQEWFYRVNLFIHHLQRYKRSAFGH